MTNRYGVAFENKYIAYAYVSKHPTYASHVVVSVIPLERKGKWEDSSLGLHLENPLHDIFSTSKIELDAIAYVLAQAKIEPFKVQIQPLDEQYEKINKN